MKKVIFGLFFLMVLSGVYGQESFGLLTITNESKEKYIAEGTNIILPSAIATLPAEAPFFVYLTILSFQPIGQSGSKAVVARATDGKRYTFWTNDKVARDLNQYVNKNRLYLCRSLGAEFLVDAMKFTSGLGLPEPTAGLIGGIVIEQKPDDIAQSIDKSQYKEIDLFNYNVEGNKKGKAYTVKYKMVLKFFNQLGTTVYFRDDAGDSFSLETTKRWSFKRGDVVTVYFTAAHRSYGVWMEEKLDDIETSTASSVKPWLPYVSNDKSGLHGWYLQDTGNGTYKEVYYE